MTDRDKAQRAELSAHLPDSPMEPFLRIVGVALAHPREAGSPCPWGIAFHVVFPTSPRPRMAVRAKIYPKGSSDPVVDLPEERYPKGPCVAHIELYDGLDMVDNEYNHVFDVHTLPEGLYTAKAELIGEDDEICQHDELSFEVAPLPVLEHSIKLKWEGWKLPLHEARRCTGEAQAGDVDGDGEIEYVHYVGARHMSVYRANGELIWAYDDPEGILGCGPIVNVWDYNGDGKAEILAPRGSYPNLRLCLLDGATGEVLHDIEYPVVNGADVVPNDAPDLYERLSASGYALPRMLENNLPTLCANPYPADFRGLGAPRDILLQVGSQNCINIVALTGELEILWTYRCDNGYGGHEGAIFDMDGDGFDEVAVGTELLDHDGKLLWSLPFDTFAAPWEDDHIDVSVAGDITGDGRIKIAYSSRMLVDAQSGERLWIDPTWHGQDVHIGKLRDDVPGLQILFGDREYYNSGHDMHGEWADVRDAEGNRLWDRRFMSMHNPQMINWLPGELSQVSVCPDLQKFPPNPSYQIFDGHGVLVDVLPSIGGYDELVMRRTVPRGYLVQHPYHPVAHGEIYVYRCGR